MKNKTTLILLTTLALISTSYVSRTVILPHVAMRLDHVAKIFSNQQTPPYQYRIFKPLVGSFLETALFPIIPDRIWRHVLAYELLSFITFLGIFFAFYTYLRMNFSISASLMGVLTLQAVIPLATTGYFMEGDFITLLFYLLGLLLIRQEKDGWLPVLLGVGALNREQIVFLLAWYLFYHIGRQTLTLRRIWLALMSFLIWLAVFAGVRWYFGLKPSPYSPALHLASNTNLNRLVTSILPLWISNVAGFVILSALAYRKSDAFHRLAFLSLLAYAAFFFVYGNLWELAKFLPAYLIMIPMSIQALSGEWQHDTPPVR